MSRSAFLVLGIVLSLLFFVPDLPLEKVEILGVKLEFSRTELVRDFVGTAIIFTIVMILLSFWGSWVEQDVEDLPEELAAQLREGLPKVTDRAKSNKIIARHRHAMAVFIVTQLIPFGIISFAGLTFLWQVFQRIYYA